MVDIFKIKALLCVYCLGMLGTACTMSPQTLLDPDAGRGGGDRSTLGPLGVESHDFSTQISVSERVDGKLYIPTKTDGPIASANLLGVVVFIQGGAVGAEQYTWLHQHLASYGFLVFSAEHPFDLAILGSDISAAAWPEVHANPPQSLRSWWPGVPLDVFAVIGHSLGGVVASGLWANGFAENLGVLASFPTEAQGVDGKDSGRVLSLSGSEDGRSEVEEVRAGWELFDVEKSLVFVEGMNHFQWVEGEGYLPVGGDFEATRSENEVRADAASVLVRWLLGESIEAREGSLSVEREE